VEAPAAARRSLAQSSLLVGITMSSTACLVVSPPEYEQPKRTAPFLVAEEAYPILEKTIEVDDTEGFVEFGGAVLSEDNGAPVEVALYIDYGQSNAAGHPYKNRVYPFEPILPGTIADGPRKFQGKRWYLDSAPVAAGCHTITMMASHEFGANVCPLSVDDSSFLVWRIAKCDANGNDCPAHCEPLECSKPCPSCADPGTDAGVNGVTP
jgi:hypothetical protein